MLSKQRRPFSQNGMCTRQNEARLQNRKIVMPVPAVTGTVDDAPVLLLLQMVKLKS